MSAGGGKKGRRKLTPDERMLWNRVAATASPLIGNRRRGSAPEAPSEDLATPIQEPLRTPGEDLMHSVSRLVRTPSRPDEPEIRFQFAAPEVGPVGRSEAGLDRRTADRLRKGARNPEARIDLHGMSAERAHRACLGFLSDAMARGHRMVLVITGKGAPDNGHGHRRGRGILRESLPGWLRASHMSRSIVGIYEAHPRHGGSGAFYIYLKRQRP